MSINREIGQTLKKVRESLGVKQETLAKHLRCSKPAISMMETGQIDFSISRLEKIAAFLKVDFLQLIISAFTTFMLLILFFFATGLFGWSDGGEKKYLERLEKTTNITFWISLLAAICVGIYIIYKMNRPKKSNIGPSPSDISSQ